MAVQSARGAAGSLPGVGGGALQFHRFSKAKVLSPLPPPSQHLCWASVTTGSWGRRRGRALGGGGPKALTCLWTIYVDLLERVQRPAGAASEHWPPSSAHLHNLEVLYYWLFPPFSSSSTSPLFAASSRKKNLFAPSPRLEGDKSEAVSKGQSRHTKSVPFVTSQRADFPDVCLFESTLFDVQQRHIISEQSAQYGICKCFTIRRL